MTDKVAEINGDWTMTELIEFLVMLSLLLISTGVIMTCLPLLIFPCTIKSRSSLLAPADPGGPGKRAVKRLWCVVVL